MAKRRTDLGITYEVTARDADGATVYSHETKDFAAARRLLVWARSGITLGFAARVELINRVESGRGAPAMAKPQAVPTAEQWRQVFALVDDLAVEIEPLEDADGWDGAVVDAKGEPLAVAEGVYETAEQAEIAALIAWLKDVALPAAGTWEKGGEVPMENRFPRRAWWDRTWAEFNARAPRQSVKVADLL